MILPIIMLLNSSGKLMWITKLFSVVSSIVGSITFKSDNTEVITVIGSEAIGSFSVFRINATTG